MQADFDWKKLQNSSDIRGVALEGVPNEVVNLTSDIAEILGQSFALWLSQKSGKSVTDLTIAVGRDSRLSGPQLMAALMNGVASQGCQVYDFSVASTPAMFMSTVTPGWDCDGAIMLTASHLPFNRNGFKFFTPTGGADKPDITEILQLSQIQAAQQRNNAAKAGEIIQCDFMSVYAANLAATIQKGVNHLQNYDKPLKGFKIVVDAGNGAGGFYVDKVLRPLGVDTSGSQFLEPDGHFPNHIPNPEDKTAIASIRQAVLDNHADFGIIFDTDVDRAAAVDSQGRELNRNRLIALMSAIILKEHPESTIVTDSITSDGLTQFIESKLKGKHHRYKRGYKNVINESIRLNQCGEESWLAIETSGHAALKENYFLDDGAYLVTKLLIELAKSKSANQTLTDLIIDLQEPQESEEFRLKINIEDFKGYGNKVIEKLKIFAGQQEDWIIVPNNYEGIRVSCQSSVENGWFLLRLSLHDPVIPLSIESNVAGDIEQITNRLRGFFAAFDALDLSPFH